MIGHSALPRSGFFVSVRRLRRLLAAAIFLHAACRHTSLVLAACCSIAERLVSYFRRSIAAARVSRVLSADSARKWTCRRLFSVACYERRHCTSANCPLPARLRTFGCLGAHVPIHPLFMACSARARIWTYGHRAVVRSATGGA